MSGDVDKARAIFEAMIQQNPDDREPYNALMAVAFSARDWEALAAAVRRRLERSQAAIDYVILGKTAMLLGKDDEALGHFQRATELFPDDPLGHNAKAGWLVHLGRDDALATRHVDRALELAPDSGYAHALKAALALIANKPEDAAARLTSALKSAPSGELANALRDSFYTMEEVAEE
jgi:tetratricopeptide (TPR) repeat protein